MRRAPGPEHPEGSTSWPCRVTLTTVPDSTCPRGAGTAAAVAARLGAVTRLLTGFVFLWTLPDKTFGLGYATTAEKAWIEGGSPSMFTNPVVDRHLVHALVLIALAAYGAGRTRGLGRTWEELPLAERHGWLR